MRGRGVLQPYVCFLRKTRWSADSGSRVLHACAAQVTEVQNEVITGEIFYIHKHESECNTHGTFDMMADHEPQRPGSRPRGLCPGHLVGTGRPDDNGSGAARRSKTLQIHHNFRDWTFGVGSWRCATKKIKANPQQLQNELRFSCCRVCSGINDNPETKYGPYALCVRPAGALHQEARNPRGQAGLLLNAPPPPTHTAEC